MSAPLEELGSHVELASKKAVLWRSVLTYACFMLFAFVAVELIYWNDVKTTDSFRLITPFLGSFLVALFAVSFRKTSYWKGRLKSAEAHLRLRIKADNTKV